MQGLLLLLRYTILVLLYLFIIKVFLFIQRDLQRVGKDGKDFNVARDAEGERSLSGGGLGKTYGELAVVTSDVEHLVPGALLPVGSTVHLGRTADNDIVISDAFTSARHAKIYFHKHHLWLEDLGSLNGTFLNDTKINKPTVLNKGDKIRIGGVILQLVGCSYES